MSTHRNALQALFAALVVAFAVSGCSVPGMEEAPHFALDGAHREIGCSACHGTSVSVELPQDCMGCHLKDRPSRHDKADCAGCHTTTSWGETVNHEELLSLKGGHKGLPCSECHQPGTYEGLNAACQSCHESDRPRNHNQGPCAKCHTVQGWGDADFDHESRLSLKGGHSGLACSECHSPGTYSGLDAACETCHEGDRPNGHFAGSCAECHSPSGWGDATFDHSQYFPIPHEGVRSCDSCHPAPAGTSDFSCTGCHTKSRTDGDHRGNSRYQWESHACLSCHPDGRD
jgi:hypothetical protein